MYATYLLFLYTFLQLQNLNFKSLNLRDYSDYYDISEKKRLPFRFNAFDSIFSVSKFSNQLLK